MLSGGEGTRFVPRELRLAGLNETFRARRIAIEKIAIKRGSRDIPYLSLLI